MFSNPFKASQLKCWGASHWTYLISISMPQGQAQEKHSALRCLNQQTAFHFSVFHWATLPLSFDYRFDCFSGLDDTLREKTGYEVSTTGLTCIYVNVSELYLALNFISPLSHSYCKTEEEPRQVNFSAPGLLTCSFTVRLGDPEITENLWVLKSTFEMAKTLLFYWANSIHAKRTEGNWHRNVHLKRTTAQ